MERGGTSSSGEKRGMSKSEKFSLTHISFSGGIKGTWVKVTFVVDSRVMGKLNFSRNLSRLHAVRTSDRRNASEYIPKIK